MLKHIIIIIYNNYNHIQDLKHKKSKEQCEIRVQQRHAQSKVEIHVQMVEGHVQMI